MNHCFVDLVGNDVLIYTLVSFYVDVWSHQTWRSLLFGCEMDFESSFSISVCLELFKKLCDMNLHWG